MNLKIFRNRELLKQLNGDDECKNLTWKKHSTKTPTIQAVTPEDQCLHWRSSQHSNYVQCASSEVNQSKFKLRHIFVNLTKIVSPKNIRVMRVTFSTLRCKIWKKLPASRGSERQLPWPCFSMYASSFRSSSAVHGPFFSPIVSSQHGALPMATYNSERASYLPNVSQKSNWIPPPPPPPELNLLATQSWTSGASYWLLQKNPLKCLPAIYTLNLFPHHLI